MPAAALGAVKGSGTGEARGEASDEAPGEVSGDSAALLEGDIDMAALQELASEETLAELLAEVEHLSEDDIAAMLG